MAKFTIEGKGRWLKIITPCTISEIPKRNSDQKPRSMECSSAQWDTGSMVTLVSTRIIEQMGLKHVGYTTLSGLENRPQKARTYMLNLKFPNDVEASFREVAEAPLPLVDMLIGMDIISDCTFHYSGSDGISKFTFEM